MARLIIILTMCIWLCCGCNDKEEVERNYFGGEGEIQMVESHNIPHIYYDDSNIYFSTSILGAGLVGIDTEGNTQLVCDDAACEHGMAKKCKGSLDSH